MYASLFQLGFAIFEARFFWLQDTTQGVQVQRLRGHSRWGTCRERCFSANGYTDC